MDPDDFAPARSTNLLWHDAAHRSEGPWPPARRMGLQPYWDNMSSWDVVMTLVPCTLFLVSLNACWTPCRDGARDGGGRAASFRSVRAIGAIGGFAPEVRPSA